MTATVRRRTPLVARTRAEQRAPAPMPVRSPAPAPAPAPALSPRLSPAPPQPAPPTRRPRPAPRRHAAGVGWWGLLLVVASFGVVTLIGTVTFERVGRRDTAISSLTAGLQRPTARLLLQELARPDGGARVTAHEDLVAFDIDRATALADPQAAARAAAHSRAVELYDKGLPPDPGPTRTEIGISRSLVGVMSQSNHDKVAGMRIAAAIMAISLLALCCVQTRDDNMLVLPACAVIGGWMLASAAKLLVNQLISGVNLASATYVRSFETAAAQPLGIARTVAVGLLAGAALYRFATLASRLREARARARARATANSVC